MSSPQQRGAFAGGVTRALRARNLVIIPSGSTLRGVHVTGFTPTSATVTVTADGGLNRAIRVRDAAEAALVDAGYTVTRNPEDSMILTAERA